MRMGPTSNRRGRSSSMLLLATILLVGAVSLPIARAGSTPEQQVTIDQFKFTPASLTVPAGTAVTWTNKDGTLHTVTSSAKAFASDGLDQGDTFSYTFSRNPAPSPLLTA